MAFKTSQLKGIQIPKIIGSASATVEHDDHLNDFLTTPKCCITSFAPIINHCYGLRKGLESLNFSFHTNNYCCGLREGLEILTSFTPTNNHYQTLKIRQKTQLISITSTSFVCSSNISDVTSFSIKSAKMGYAFWLRNCQHSGIKDLTLVARSLSKYIQEVILGMVLTNK